MRSGALVESNAASGDLGLSRFGASIKVPRGIRQTLPGRDGAATGHAGNGTDRKGGGQRTGARMGPGVPWRGEVLP